MTLSGTSQKITIGLTCYNAEASIKRALSSALAQDWPDIEIVVVDDCSSDASWPIIVDMASRHPALRPVRHQENRGTGAARNTILSTATGDFIAFFDDDDESLPQRVRRQYEVLEAYKHKTGASMIACYASGVRKYPNGYELEMPAIGSRPLIPAGPAVAEYLLYNGRHPGLFYGCGMPTCALMAHVSSLRSVGGFDPTLRRVEDVDLAIRMALQNGHFIGTSEKLIVQHATMAPDKGANKNLEAELALIDKYAEFLKEKRLYDYARRWFLMRFLHFSGQRWRFLFALLALVIRYPVRASLHLRRTVPTRWVHEKKMKRVLDRIS